MLLGVVVEKTLLLKVFSKYIVETIVLMNHWFIFLYIYLHYFEVITLVEVLNEYKP